MKPSPPCASSCSKPSLDMNGPNTRTRPTTVRVGLVELLRVRRRVLDADDVLDVGEPVASAGSMSMAAVRPVVDQDRAVDAVARCPGRRGGLVGRRSCVRRGRRADAGRADRERVVAELDRLARRERGAAGDDGHPARRGVDGRLGDRRRSSVVCENHSPDVPLTSRPCIPCSMYHSSRARSESRSRLPSSVNGVGQAGQ